MPITETNVASIEATTQLLRAGWHPVKIQALTILTERTASPKEIAEELGLTKAKAGYCSFHVKELVKLGLVALDRTEPRRGASEHFYRAVMPLIVSTEDANRMSLEERLLFTCWILACVSHDFARAVESGAIDERIDRHLTRIPMLLDEQGYQDLYQEHERLFERTQEIQAEAQERLAESGEEPMPTSAIVASFPLPPNGPRPLDH